MTNKKSRSEVLKKRGKKKETSLVFTLFKWSIFGVILLALLGSGGLVGLYMYLSRDLPKITSLT
ncbi:MAG: hypothetical protein MI892_25305, partial [Desulfobacterales bacterium]|nr:hypothetical protein [Desulfobacterales bacterium]